MAFVHEDWTEVIVYAQKIGEEQRGYLKQLEERHGELLIYLKEIQLEFDLFRTKILEERAKIDRIEMSIHKEKDTHRQMEDQTMKRMNHLLNNIDEIYQLLIDYKSLLDQIDSLGKLIGQNQYQIESHHKSLLQSQTKLEKIKQDRSLILIEQIQCKDQCHQIEKIIERQMNELQQLEEQSKQMIDYRQTIDQQMKSLEQEQQKITNEQYHLLQSIKQAKIKRNSLKKDLAQSQHTIEQVKYFYRSQSQLHHRYEEKNQSVQKSSSVLIRFFSFISSPSPL